MGQTRAWRFGVAMGVLMAGVAAASGAQAQAGNAAYQTYFRNVCVGATGALAARCVASRGGELSGDSESSLNPNQAAVTGSNALSRAQALAAVTEQRLEGLRDEIDDTAAQQGAFSLFGSVQGEWSDQDRGAFENERGWDGDATRFTVGADWRLSPSATVGASVSFGDSDLDYDASPSGNAFTPQADTGGVSVDDVTVTVFGAFRLSDRVWMDAAAGLGWADYDLRRNAVFQESNRIIPQTNVTATASPDGRQSFATVGLGYDAEMGPVSVGPYARLRLTRTKVDAYTETDAAGSGLALSVDKGRGRSLLSVLGVRASYAASTSWGVVLPQARFEYEHEFEDDARSTATRLALDSRNTAFAVRTDAPDRNAFNLGAGLLLVLPGGWMPYVDYEALLGYRGQDRHRLTAGLRVEF